LQPARPAEPESRDGNQPPKAVADPLQFNDIVPAFRDQVPKYGNDLMALPFGGSALVLIYRVDAFTSEANRTVAEKEKRKLAPPSTWAELDELARFFHGRDWTGDGKPDFGVALALGTDAERLGTDVFLARAAALGQHRDQYSFLFDADTMKPRIDSPPFV